MPRCYFCLFPALKTHCIEKTTTTKKSVNSKNLIMVWNAYCICAVESYSVHGEASVQPDSVLTPSTAGCWVRLASDLKNLVVSAHNTCCVLWDDLTCATWGIFIGWGVKIFFSIIIVVILRCVMLNVKQVDYSLSVECVWEYPFTYLLSLASRKIIKNHHLLFKIIFYFVCFFFVPGSFFGVTHCT